MNKKYGIIEFIGNQCVARLRYKNAYINKVKDYLLKFGYFKGRDFEIEKITNTHTTFRIICNVEMITRLKIFNRRLRIDDLNNEINNLNSLL